MTEVRIRHEDEIVGAYLTSVHLDQIDDVIPTLTRWGGVTDYENNDLTGQFVYYVDQREAFFEVVIHASQS